MIIDGNQVWKVHLHLTTDSLAGAPVGSVLPQVYGWREKKKCTKLVV